MSTKVEYILGDCLDIMRDMKDNSVDLVFGSPPYEAARTYDIGFNKTGQDWVDWMFPIFVESVRICKGLVAFVVEGQTRRYQYSCTPALLMADLHRAGIKLRKPAIYKRSGIPGTGGPDWLRNNWEWIICASKGKLPWSCNVACGEKPKKGSKKETWMPTRQKDGTLKGKMYTRPERVNPGNIIAECGVLGNGQLDGTKMVHENEAAFTEKLPRFFIRSFCPPDGIVLDPFVGSGTTVLSAEGLGRNAIGIDIRESQIELCKRRAKLAFSWDK